jgi:peptidoglycan/xylan/chitin deacetylase (PgdA/CDA1 family)
MLLRQLPTRVLRRFAGTITHVTTHERVAALTFDDGPNPESTPKLLDLLRTYDACATFFVVGLAVQRHKKLVAAMADAGHAIGAHSWDHQAFPVLSSGERRRQLRACFRVAYPYGQRIFRPPYGLQTLASRLDAALCGYGVITWSLDVGDWCESDPARMTTAALRRIRPGSVLLFHDAIFRPTNPRVHPDRQAMLTALDQILDQLKNTYRFVTIPELLRLGHAVRRNWYVRNHEDWATLESRW